MIESPKRKRDSALVDVYHPQENERENVFATKRNVFNATLTEEEALSISEIELSKPEDLKDLIVEVNGFLSEFISGYGAQPIFLGMDRILFLDWDKLNDHQKEIVKKGREGQMKGFYIPKTQQIIVFEEYKEGRRLYFAHILTHEILHLNSYQAVELGSRVSTTGESINITKEKRMGLNIYHGRNTADKATFHNLDEAVIEELTIRFENLYLSKVSGTEKEYGAREAVRERWKNDPSKSSLELGIAVRTKGEDLDGNKIDTLETWAYPYKKERDYLNKLIDELFTKNGDKFTDREEVFNLFARAVMNGELRSLAQLIDDTFGRGSFKKLGEETSI